MGKATNERKEKEKCTEEKGAPECLDQV